MLLMIFDAVLASTPIMFVGEFCYNPNRRRETQSDHAAFVDVVIFFQSKRNFRIR